MRTIKLFLLPLLGLLIIGCGDGNNENKITASGTIEGTNVTLSARVSGQINKIRVEEGDQVKKNDTLLIIDHELLEIQLQQAQAGVEAAQAQLQLLQKGARSEDIRQAEDALKQAKINYEQAEADKNRMEDLYQSKTITKKQYDDVTAKYNIAKARYNSAKENVKKVKNFARPEELKQAQANLNQSKAAAALLKKNIRDSYVLAPLDGFVVKKFVEEGETVSPMSSLLMLSNLDDVKLVIYVSEEELGRVKLGQAAKVNIDANDNTYEGKVIYISPEAEFTPKNIQTKDERTKLVFAVKVKIPNPNFELKPGMPADATILLNENMNNG